MGWEEALRLLNKAHFVREKKEAETKPKKKYLPNGFYENTRTHHIILAIQLQDEPRKYHVVRPHLGHQSMPRYHSELKRRYKKLTFTVAKERWIQKYEKEVKGEKGRKDSFG